MLEIVDDADGWGRTLGAVIHDVFATYTWGRASGQSDGGRPVLAVVRDPGVICATSLLIRRVDGVYHDASSPYGYPGICFAPNVPFDQRVKAIGELSRGLASLGLVSCFIRENPLFNQDGNTDLSGVVTHGQTVSIDLTQSGEWRLGQLSSGHRYEIRRTSQAGVRVEVRSDGLSWLYFRGVYDSTMARLQASRYYYWSDAYWSVLREMEAAGNASLLIAHLDGQKLAGAIFLHDDRSGVVHYHLAAAHRTIERIFPGKLLIAEAANVFSRRAYRRLHLGGGLGGRADSLFAFKAGFSRDRHAFNTRRIVLLPDVYSRLSLGSRTDYFPAYRSTSSCRRNDPQ